MEEIDIIFSTAELEFVNNKVTVFRVIFKKHSTSLLSPDNTDIIIHQNDSIAWCCHLV